MPTHTRHRFLLLAATGTLILSSLAFVPSSQAVLDTSGFTAEALAGTLDSFSLVRVDSAGESVGLVGKYTGTGNLAFFWKADADTDWVDMNHDLAGANPNPTQYNMAACGNGDFYVFGWESDTTDLNRLYYSSDDGATWTDVESRAVQTGLFGGLPDVDCTPDGDVGIAYFTATGHIVFTRSADQGTTWCTNDPVELSDNRGSPSTAGSDFIDTQNNYGGISLHYNGDAWWVAYVGGTAAGSVARQHVLQSASETGCGFWDIPYTTDGGLTASAQNSCTAGNDQSFKQGGIYSDPGLSGFTPFVLTSVFGTCSGGGAAGTLNRVATTYPIANEWFGSTASTLCSSNGALPFSQHLPGVVVDGELYFLSGTTAGTTVDVVLWDGTTTDPATVSGLPFPSSVASCTWDIARTDTQIFIAYVDGSTGQPKVISGDFPQEESETGAQAFWCSQPSSLDFGDDGPDGSGDDDFGYNYVEGVGFFDGEPSSLDEGGSSGFEDAFEFTSEDDNYAYMGKGWTTPATTVRTYFRIEASVEGTDSEFRTAYSFLTDTPSSTSKGNGDDSGAFDFHIEARLDEEGNDWNFRIRMANTGDPLTTIGADVNSFDPNTPHTFYFEVNTTAPGYARIVDAATGNTILNRPMASSGITDYANLVGNPMYSQWFVSMGSNTIVDTYTFLDDPVDHTGAGLHDGDSTCIEFEPSVLITGHQGSTPDSQVPDLDDNDGDGVPNDVDVDVDGDGLCNGDEDYPAGTPGAQDGCTAGDADDDGDGTLDIFDDTPLGPTNSDGTGGDSSGSASSGIFGPMIASFGTFLGGGDLVGGLVVSILLILGFGAIGAGVAAGSVIGYGVGSGLGLTLSLTMGIFPFWPIVVFVIGCAVYLFVSMRR